MGDFATSVPVVDMAGATGWETYAARVQEERSGPGFGSTTPSHLTRVLYIPRHDGSASHHSLHDISVPYKETVAQRAMGTASYVVSLGQIPKPPASGSECAILYNVDFKEAGASGAASLNTISVVPSSSSSGQGLVEADVTIDVAGDEAAVITMKRHEETEKAKEPTTMSISYPIAPLTWRKSVFVHPYFAFQSPDDEGSYFEWQMHPVLHGRLRYTLVRVPRMRPSGSPAQLGIPSDDSILAIYHHIGDGVSLPLPYSEGVLLLSDMNLTTETMVVASVFGMLEQLRRLSKTGKGVDATKKSGLGFVKGLLNRKGVCLI